MNHISEKVNGIFNFYIDYDRRYHDEDIGDETKNSKYFIN